MEVELEICKIADSYYCIWFENGLFQIEDVDFRKILQISKDRLIWFIEALSELVASCAMLLPQKR